MIGKRIRVGTLAGVPFHITVLWLGVFLLATYSISQPGPLSDYLELVSLLSTTSIDAPLFTEALPSTVFAAVLVASLYASVVLHELGHIYGAKRHGVGVAGITLWVLGGAAEITDQPENARAEFEFTIAGPLVSLAIGASMLTLGYLFAPLASDALTAYFFLLAVLNLGMLLLNLVPAFPLDGGRLFRSALTAAVGYERATLYATRTGKIIAVGVGVFSILTGHLFGSLLAGFVFLAARSENKRVQTHARRYDAVEGFMTDATGTPPAPSEITGNTFVFETEVPTYTMPTVTALIDQYGGTVASTVSDETDYIIVPEPDADKYTAIAEHHNARPVPATFLAQHLNALDSTRQTRRSTSD